MVKVHLIPGCWRVAALAILAEASLVRIDISMTGGALLGRRFQVIQIPGIGMAVYTILWCS